MEYAEQFHVETILCKYLEVLLGSGRLKGPKKRMPEQDAAFIAALTELLQEE